ncbi:hypothetical protein [Marinomonas atlantica]|uniref:hypothetical protein n=1 Tax=Marinomonas atlantica TaxID=1806668 RepID=UPI0008310BE7|nr:hypothetical protein [Marinomonas atlantica]
MSKTQFEPTAWSCSKTGLKIEVTRVEDDKRFLAVRDGLGRCLSNDTFPSMDLEAKSCIQDKRWLANHRFTSMKNATDAIDCYWSSSMAPIDSSECSLSYFDISKTLRQVELLASEVRSRDKELARLRSRQFFGFNNEECWLWMGDGTDHLESLVCPVVISPVDLMALIQKSEGEA